MEHSMDPYEQQLLSVFTSFDVSHCGSLDQEGLLQLCNSLQLEEQGVELIKCLLSETKSRVSFNEFKEGLLALLGRAQSCRQKLEFNTSSESESESPDREVSPKFVFGSKKYGRRSRPESAESVKLFEELNTNLEEHPEDIIEYENKSLKILNKVQRSNSQNDVTYSRKRKTSGKLKRCTSFPGNREMEHQFKSQEKQVDKKMLSSSDINVNVLRAALDHLGVGSDGYLHQLEIVTVCEYLGMQKLATNILDQIVPNPELNVKITVEQLIDLLHKDKAQETISAINGTCNSSVTENTVLFPNTKSMQQLSLGPNGSGVIPSQTVVELWENAGIASANNLLQELGFTSTNILICDLASVLDEELRNLIDSGPDILYTSINNPQIVLLIALITLYQSEIKYLKSALEQVSAERDKLKIDIFEANQRAYVLAQEVDDNHAKLEKSTQNQVRILEQRHSDVLKELNNQYVSEKEHLSLLNCKLEQKITNLETEEGKLKANLTQIQEQSNSLEKENNYLSNKLSELEQIRVVLMEKVTYLENECQKISEMERERDQLQVLFDKLSLLQAENAELRDKNDELCTEVENLNLKMNGMRAKTPNLGEENVAVICEGVGLGAVKRRVDSPSKSNKMDIESPRLGKMRRCYKNQPEVLMDALKSQIPFNSSESGFEAELDYSDSSLSITGNEEEISQLKARIQFLEQLLSQNAIPIPNTVAESINKKSVKVCIKSNKDLDYVIEEVYSFLTKTIGESKNEENCDKLQSLLNLVNKMQKTLNNSEDTHLNDSSNLNQLDNNSTSDLQDMLKIKISENKELTERCEDLDQALELLRNEFENCENYWSNKLDEERQIFDQEQKQSNDKLTELLIKIADYEEQFTTQNTIDGRLSPIEEKDCLEQQFADLELEFSEFKNQTSEEICTKNKKIEALQQELSALKNRQISDMSVQTDFEDCNNAFQPKVNNLSHVVESANIFSSETLPHNWQYTFNSISTDSSIVDTERNETDSSVWIRSEQKQNSLLSSNSELNKQTDKLIETEPFSSLPPNISWQPLIDAPPTQPHSFNYIPNESTSKNYRQRRIRKHDKNILNPQNRFQRKEKEFYRHTELENPVRGPPQSNFGPNDSHQTCVVPVHSIHRLYNRLNELDQHCRHLQFILKHQQRHSEHVMHHCWQQHKEETNELQVQIKSLQEKLSRSDMLIKELYIENTYLIANNQRLEQRCHMLAQCNTESTSV